MSVTAKFMADFRAELQAHRDRLEHQPINAKPTPAPVPELVEQIRDLLASWPPSARQRVHAPMLLPLLKGKRKAHPHILHVGNALRKLGYRQVRSWTEPDGVARRYWTAPETV